MLVNDAIAVSQPACNNEQTGSTSVGITVSGQTRWGSVLVITPDMTWTDCTGWTSNVCFFAVDGITVTHFSISGMGYGNTGLSSNVTIFGLGSDDFALNFGVSHIGGNDSKVTGLGYGDSLNVGGYCIDCFIVAAGSKGLSVIGNGTANFSESFVADSSTYQVYLNSGSSLRSQHSAFVNTASTGGSTVYNGGGTWYSNMDKATSPVNVTTYASNNLSAIAYMKGATIQSIYNSNTVAAINIASGKLYLSGSNVSSQYGRGLSISGGTFYDGCDNVITGVTPLYFTSGTAYGDCSITGTTQTSTNVALTSGWGTGAVVSAVSGATVNEAFTIMPAGTPGASPVVTVTFPTSFLTAPVCTITQTGGTFGTLTNPTFSNSATSTAITFSGTPSTSQTYTFLLTCHNPNQ
jgi:hypothetical protein